jgi:Stigma-specific protein, Stig1
MTDRFDEFSKSLATESVSRRQSLRLLGAALAGSVLAPFGLRNASAGGPDPCRNFCNQCPKWQRNQCLAACRACVQASGRICGTCSGFDCCHDSEACCGKTCCGESQTCCGDYCADLASDVDNCGACGNDCPPYPGIEGFAVCNAGACEYHFCLPGTDYNWDSSNCGRCGNVCPWGSGCAFGVCGSPGGGDGF